MLALGLIAGLAIAGQILVQDSLERQREGGQIVNTAGYQRMLSQRISLKLVVFQAGQPTAREDLNAILSLRDRWVAAHEKLSVQVGKLAYGEAAQATMESLLSEVAAPLRRISAMADRLAVQGKLTEDDRRTLLADQEIFLPLMDAVVLGLEKSVRARVAYLQGVEFVLLGLTLVVLALEALLIFRPAVQRLQASLEQLEQRNRQSAKRLESLRHLAGGVAHHFNNLLTGILGHADLQRVDAIASGQSTEYIDAQITGCHRAADIVSQLLKYSGYGPLLCQPLSLGPWLQGLGAKSTSAQSKIYVEVEVMEEAVASVDPAALTQAVEGLLANALEAMKGHLGTITLRLEQVALAEPRVMSGPYQLELPPGLYACLRVIDHGVGMTAEQMNTMFEPFHTNKEFGRGLGLAAILGIVHGHGGGIEVVSQYRRGSTVSIFLPLLIDPAGNQNGWPQKAQKSQKDGKATSG